MIRAALWLFSELLVLFLGVSFGLTLLRRRLGDERLRSLMGASPLGAALRGIAIGFVTPFCTYSAIPVLVSLRQAGVSAAGYVAFIVAAPVLDPVLFGALAIIVGFPAAMIYLVVAFAAALMLALLAERVDLDRFMKPLRAGVNGLGHNPGTDGTPWRGLRREWRPAMQSSGVLLRTMLPLLVVGIGIGMAITAFLPAEAVARVPSLSGGQAIPAAAAVGTFFYINTELFVPIADALRSAGIGIGAIVALTIAGAGANVPEFVILARLTTRRVLAVFGGYVFTVAMAGWVTLGNGDVRELANLGSRLGARILDWILVGVVVAVLAVIGIVGAIASGDGATFIGVVFGLALTVLVITLLYEMTMIALRGQTRRQDDGRDQSGTGRRRWYTRLGKVDRPLDGSGATQSDSYRGLPAGPSRVPVTDLRRSSPGLARQGSSHGRRQVVGHDRSFWTEGLHRPTDRRQLIHGPLLGWK